MPGEWHICLYTMEKDWQVEPWKYWLKKINPSNSTLLEYFHSAIEQEVWKMPDKICSFIVTSSASIFGSHLDDNNICNTANYNYTKKLHHQSLLSPFLYTFPIWATSPSITQAFSLPNLTCCQTQIWCMYTLASQQSSRCGKIQMQDVTIEMYILSFVTFVKEITKYKKQQLQP
jgi:hypothetical protein